MKKEKSGFVKIGVINNIVRYEININKLNFIQLKILVAELEITKQNVISRITKFG
jgi:hypothetical protein